MDSFDDKKPLKDDLFGYNQEDDIQDNNNNLIDASSHGNEENIQDLIDQETVEPDLMFICKNDSDAVDLLKKCAKWANECDWTGNKPEECSNWETMKKYLISINDSSSRKAEQLNAKDFIKNFYLGVCHFRQKKYEDALSYFLLAYKFQRHYQIIYNIALCYIKLGNLENAVFYLEAVTKENPNFFFAYYNLIKIYLKKNNNQEAHLIYKEFSEIMKKENEKEKFSEQTGVPAASRLSINSFNALKLFYKIGAECLFAMRYYQDCLFSILESLKFNPDDAELWFLYAKVFVMKKNFEYAIPLIQKALEIEPDYPEAQKLLKFLEENMD